MSLKIVRVNCQNLVVKNNFSLFFLDGMLLNKHKHQHVLAPPFRETPKQTTTIFLQQRFCLHN